MVNTPTIDIRTGFGYDVHRFDDDRSNPKKLLLCGIKIDHPRPLKGHSDADVALHAITDALLGTLGAGDIGEHFPDTDPQWRGANSWLFVEHAMKMLHAEHGTLNHIDLTIICQKPRITPYKPQMKQKLMDFLKLTEHHVNVKATTTEKLGFTGREEGIAVHAVATCIFEPRK